jgi:DNA-binding NtrC family response regulator
MNTENIHLVSDEKSSRKSLEPSPADRLAWAAPLPEWLGTSPAIEELRNLIRHVARSHATVLIQGEPGTGKKLVARELHRQGTRADQPFILVDCAALPDSALEVELFGPEKPSVANTTSIRPGCFQLAQGGTVVLHEISLLPLSIQARLLRLMQKQEIERPGGSPPLPVDVRLLAASSRDLGLKVKHRQFREDLFQAFNSVPVYVPPLRKRPDDIALLFDHFRRSFARKFGTDAPAVSPACLAALQHYEWPGNVRELQILVERAVLLCRNGAVLEPAHFGLPASSPAMTPTFASGEEADDLGVVEKKHIFAVLTRCHGNRTHAAKRLGISIRTLRNKLKAYRANDSGAATEAIDLRPTPAREV